MVLYPKDGSPYVFYLQAGVLRLYDRATWDRDKTKGQALTELDGPEGASIAWFLRYWLGESTLQPGYQMHGKVNAQFDF
jgi:hypothetical protein